MRHTNGSILVVDDDEDIRELLKVFLEADGYCVKVAADGLDALEQLQNSVRPSLILLDLMMPRMNGERFLKELRASPFAETAVIILSGNAAAKKKANEFNANCCLMKPVEFDELLNTVRRFVPVHSKKDAA
jgi:DNA-binding response OmpR family regulator